MPIHRSRRALLGLSSLLLLALPRAARAQDRAAAELVALNDALLAAVKAGDAARAASFYADDAALLPPDGGVVRGRDAITRFWAPGAAAIDSADTEIVAARADQRTGFVSGRYRLVLRAKADGARSEARGTFLLAFVRERGGWRIAQDMWTSAPAAP